MKSLGENVKHSQPIPLAKESVYKLILPFVILILITGLYKVTVFKTLPQIILIYRKVIFVYFIVLYKIFFSSILLYIKQG